MVSFFGFFGGEPEDKESVEVSKEAPLQTLINVDKVIQILQRTRDDMSMKPKYAKQAEALDEKIKALTEFKLELINKELLGSE